MPRSRGTRKEFPSKALITRDRFDAVAFDLDGVITNTARIHEMAWKQLFNDYLRLRAERDDRPYAPFTSADYRRHLDGRPRRDGIKAFLASRQISILDDDAVSGADTITNLAPRKNELFLHALESQKTQVYTDALALIRSLRQRGFKTAVVSASKNCQAVLQAAGITELFDVSVDGLDQERLNLKGKPEPDAFLEAAARMRIEPARTIIVEDALAGVAAGRTGHFGLVVGVSRSGAPEALTAHGADIVVTDLSTLVVGTGSRAERAPPARAQSQRSSAPLNGQQDVEGKAIGPWALVYDGFDAAVEGQREALLTLGNGYFATRGAGADAVADGVRYPGTYLAGGYNRGVSEIAGRRIEHEDLVNLPNWLPLTVGAVSGGGIEWLGLRTGAQVIFYRRTLDLRRGLLIIAARFRDGSGRVTSVKEVRLVHMRERHLAGQQMVVTPENWSGRLVVRCAIDGRVTNAGVARYRPFTAQHLVTRESLVDADTLLLRTELAQSELQIAQAARVRIFRDGDPFDADRRRLPDHDCAGQELTLDVHQGQSLAIEKIVSLFTSRDQAISDPRTEALTSLRRVEGFSDRCARAIASPGRIYGTKSILNALTSAARRSTPPIKSFVCTFFISCRPYLRIPST